MNPTESSPTIQPQEEQFQVRQRLGFAAVENEIIEDDRLVKEHLTVYLALAYHSNQEGENAWPSYKRIALYARCSRSKAVECIRDLEEWGYIQKKARIAKDGDRTSNAYFLPSMQERYRTHQKAKAGGWSAPETTPVRTGNHGGPPRGQEQDSSEPDSGKKREERGPDGSPELDLEASEDVPLSPSSTPKEKIAGEIGTASHSPASSDSSPEGFAPRASVVNSGDVPLVVELGLIAEQILGFQPPQISAAAAHILLRNIKRDEGAMAWTLACNETRDKRNRLPFFIKDFDEWLTKGRQKLGSDARLRAAKEYTERMRLEDEENRAQLAAETVEDRLRTIAEAHARFPWPGTASAATAA